MSDYQLHLDDAIAHLTALLSSAAQHPASARSGNPSNHRCDVWLLTVARDFWQRRRPHVFGNVDEDHLPVECLKPFADAAWELCRIGVLRPGPVVPSTFGMIGVGQALGCGFSLTEFGERWVRNASERPPADPSRFLASLGAAGDRFGPAFEARAVEAAACYRTGNYLACCAMCGAATESIILAVASLLRGSERALAEYGQSGGRQKTINRIATSRGQFGQQFSSLAGNLTYWRDEASHGIATAISEVEASFGLVHLQRLAQLVHHNWSSFTTPVLLG